MENRVKEGVPVLYIYLDSSPMQDCMLRYSVVKRSSKIHPALDCNWPKLRTRVGFSVNGRDTQARARKRMAEEPDKAKGQPGR